MAQHPPQRQPLGNWRWPLSAVLWLVALAVSVVPLANLWLKAGWESAVNERGVLEHHWTWSRLAQTLFETGTLFTAEFQWTATLAFASSSLAMFAAALLRWKSGSRGARRVINILCLMLIAMPGPLVAALTSQLFLSNLVPGLDWLYDHTLLAPILAQQTRLLPLAWLLVCGIVSTISPQAWELAAIDQLSTGLQLRIVLWRPTWRLWLTAWWLLAAVSAGELSTHLLLLPPGVTTLAQRLFEFLHFGMRYQDSGLCLALVLLGWLVAISVWNTRTGRA
jgi:ABC-type Fe3+ transport system permease subunit